MTNVRILIILPTLFAFLALSSADGRTRGRVVLDSTSSLDDHSWSFRLSGVLGYKYLGKDWTPARHQLEFGLVDFDFGKNTWPVNLCAQLLLSYSPVVPQFQGVLGNYSGTYELNLGIRKVFRLGSTIQPHISGGLGILGASTTTRFEAFDYVQEENKSAVGFWGNAGFYWVFSKDYLGGVSVQYSQANLTMFRHSLGAGGFHLLFYLGWHW